ncbi:hypothetical protein CS022_03965 [Veronia nyctiphanis]|uniref:Outer membrane protein beta-barrel domain-containing protein n=1 Tax=Veronia nyctiphanis TaxID=1278244 RepID=A0A4Q0YYR8_9GAMM|nr:hypothetical protein [Veronia nyctiphanis]RXJ74231.1 hypothetical protein CS022_03965 [Veronia nyctiphanis]
MDKKLPTIFNRLPYDYYRNMFRFLLRYLYAFKTTLPYALANWLLGLHMKRHLVLASAPIFFVLSQPAFALESKAGWEVSLGLGYVHNAKEKIEIEREGKSNIIFSDAKFKSTALEVPIYYSLKAGRWDNSSAFEVEFIHNKLFIAPENLSHGVNHFEISHGFNLVYVNYAVEMNNWIARGGVGPVIASPTISIDGVESSEDYQLAGITTQFGLERELLAVDSFSLGVEGKVSYSYTKLDLDDGSVTVPNTALHLLFNLKYML